MTFAEQLSVWLRGPINHLRKARNIDVFIQEMSVKDLFSVDVDTHEL